MKRQYFKIKMGAIWLLGLSVSQKWLHFWEQTCPCLVHVVDTYWSSLYYSYLRYWLWPKMILFIIMLSTCWPNNRHGEFHFMTCVRLSICGSNTRKNSLFYSSRKDGKLNRSTFALSFERCLIIYAFSVQSLWRYNSKLHPILKALL